MYGATFTMVKSGGRLEDRGFADATWGQVNRHEEGAHGEMLTGTLMKRRKRCSRSDAAGVAEGQQVA